DIRVLNSAMYSVIYKFLQRFRRHQAFRPDLFLQFQETSDEGLRPWRATGNVDVDRNNTVYAFDYMIAVLPVGSSAIGTGAHGNYIARLGHLFIKSPDAVGHLEGDRSCDDHYVGLSGGRAGRHSEAVHVIYRRPRDHKLKRAACDTKRHGKHRRKACPIDQVVECGNNDASFFKSSVQ